MVYDGGVNSVLPIDYVSGIVSFFIVSSGGILMGIIWGFLGSFITRFTGKFHTIEPIFVFLIGYFAYLSAEMLTFSGILR